ncbi:MAG: helix-turn-helix domain-containing protein [Bryobacteraceae bacterium]
MGELRKHWTARSIEDFLYRVGFDFVQQIEKFLDAAPANQASLARSLGVTEGRVSQVLNNPGNLTLRKVIEYARALRQKVAIVLYDDNDYENANGPINPEIFTRCWERSGKPSDFFAIANNCDEAMVSLGRETISPQKQRRHTRRCFYHIRSPRKRTKRNYVNSSRIPSSLEAVGDDASFRTSLEGQAQATGAAIAYSGGTT